MIEFTTYKHVSGPDLVKEIAKVTSKDPYEIAADFWDWFEPVEGTSLFFALPESTYHLNGIAKLAYDVLIANGCKAGDQLYFDFDDWSNSIT